MEWQPIETALEDDAVLGGQTILAVWDGVVTVAKWIAEEDDAFGGWSGWVTFSGMPRMRAEAPTLWAHMQSINPKTSQSTA